MRYPALQGKRDANEPAIIKALEAAGATVEPLPTGRGVPDLLVGFNDFNQLLEVKTHQGVLNPKQVKWHGNWNGSVHTVRTPAQALAAIGYEEPLDCRCRRNGL
jgi:hypothetical protein